MAVEVKIKNIPQVKASVIKLFNEIRKDKELLTDIGVKVVEQTQNFNRAGKSPGGKRHHSISSEWIDRKEQLKTVNPTSEYYRNKASNVTFTGQLLRSIRFLIKPDSGSVDIMATGKRKPYKNLDGTSVKKTPTNEKLSEYLKDGGRNIFGINKQISNNINKIVRLFLSSKIRKSIFKSSKD